MTIMTDLRGKFVQSSLFFCQFFLTLLDECRLKLKFCKASKG